MEENFRRHAPGGDRTLDVCINFNTAVTKQYINSLKIVKLYSPGKVNTRYVSGKDNGHIWLLRKDKVNKNSYIFHDLSVIFSIGITV